MVVRPMTSAAGTLHEAFGVRLFKAPPKRFDPRMATDRELLVHGFPARPDPERHPKAYELWHQVLSRPVTVIQPQFELMSALPAPAPTSGDGWCGSTVTAPKGDSIQFVGGVWTVPNVVAPRGQNSVCGCAEWVGIDGYDELSPDIVQAGTTQLVIPVFGQLLHQTFAWFEWYPAPPVTVSNFPVSPGDVVGCVICVHTPTEVGVYMNNLTQGVLTSFIKTAPNGQQLVGNTAEWILESPVSGWLGPLCKFAVVYFDSCVAASAGRSGGRVFLGGNEHLVDMHDANGQNIAKADRVTDKLITIRYTGPQ